MVCTFRTRASRLAATLLGLMFLVGSPALAQSPPGIAIVTPSHAAVLTGNESWYFDGTQMINVVGVVSGIPNVDLNKWLAVLQGVEALTLVPVAGTTDQYTFSTWLWIGPDPTRAPGGAVPSGYLYSANMRDTRRLHLPIFAELINRDTNASVSRSRVVLHDMRFGGGDPGWMTPSEPEGVAFQLTASGLDALERPHRNTTPWPTLDAFNESLQVNATGIQHAVTMDTRYGASGKSCIPLTSDSPLLGTNAWTNILAEANAHYASYESAKYARDTATAWLPAGFIPGAIVNLGLAAYLKAECVQEPAVRANQFEVCVDTLNGQMTDLSIAGVDDIDLAFGDASKHVTADVGLGRVRGTVRGSLADVFLRWNVTHARCSLRPKANVQNTTLSSTPELQAWSTCEGLRADAAAARTWNYTTGALKPFDFTVNRGSNREFLDVKRAGSKGKFQLSPDRDEFADVGTCFSFLTSSYELLNLFYPDMQNVLNSTWTAGSPNTHQSQALDELTAAFEVGRVQPDDLSLTYRFDTVQSKVAFPGGGTPTVQFPAPDGLVGLGSTDARLNRTAQILQPWKAWVRAAPVVLDQIFSVNGQSYFNRPFDAAYVVTTNTFNQLIRERSGTDLLYFTLQLTWGDLGMTSGPAGEPATDPAVLTGTLLGQQLDLAFSAIGDYGVTITARPTTLPFTFIPPDQPPLPFPQFTFGHAPITYQLGQYEIVVSSDNPAIPHVLTMVVDMFDDEFQVGLSATTGSRTLDVAPQHDEWRTLLLSTHLSCPFTPLTPLTGPGVPLPPACEAPIVQNLASLVQPVLKDKLTRLVTGLPAPQVFEVPSATGEQLRELHQVDMFTNQQRIVLYGNIRVPQ